VNIRVLHFFLKKAIVFPYGDREAENDGCEFSVEELCTVKELRSEIDAEAIINV
jgi:hypothetical protein